MVFLTVSRGVGTLCAAFIVGALLFLTGSPAVYAQNPPMLFTGTAIVDGAPVAAGTVVRVYDQTGNQLAQTNTGGYAGQPANYWQLQVLAPQLEDQPVFFYIIESDGSRLLPATTGTYDAIGPTGGRAQVNIVAFRSRAPDVVLSQLVNAQTSGGRPLLNIAWVQELQTGNYVFFAPGVVSTMTRLEPNTPLFLNLAQQTRLRISGRLPVTVASGGVWVALGDLVSIEIVP